MNMSILQSLPNREFTCGMGEILKTGLICDEEFFRFVCKNQPEISKLDLSMLSRMIRRCCEIKAGVVERDPKEQGERALLKSWSHSRTCSRKNEKLSAASWTVCWSRSDRCRLSFHAERIINRRRIRRDQKRVPFL